MDDKLFIKFAQNVLDVVQLFVNENKFNITFGTSEEKSEIYEKNKLPIGEETLYFINSQRKKDLFYLRFIKQYDGKGTHAVVIDNGSISLTLNQKLERITEYPSNDFNERIDNIKGNFKIRLMKYLYVMLDYSYAIEILYNS